MPVQKFRDFETARRALWLPTGDRKLPERIRRLWAFSTRLAPRALPRGVRKFRSIDDANQDRKRWQAYEIWSTHKEADSKDSPRRG